MKQHRLREKSSSLKKSKASQFPKTLSVRQLPKYAQGSSGKKSLKDTTKRKPTNNNSSVQQRVANIKRGFLQLEKKLAFQQPTSRTAALKESEVKHLLESDSKQSRTRRQAHSRTPHKCVYERAVYSLISIIDQQKYEIELLRKQLGKRAI